MVTCPKSFQASRAACNSQRTKFRKAVNSAFYVDREITHE